MTGGLHDPKQSSGHRSSILHSVSAFIIYRQPYGVYRGILFWCVRGSYVTYVE